MVTCSRCGATLNNPNALFCSNCGAQTASSGATTPSFVPPPAAAGVAYAPAPSVPQKKGHPVLKVFGIITAVFVGFVIWGAVLQSKHTGTPTTSGSATYANSYEESQQMCAVIAQRLKDYFRGSANGLECKSGMGDDGTLGLIIAYPYPVLGKDGEIKNNALLYAFAMAGESMSEHARVPVGRVYVMDSSSACFVVPGMFARQIYTKALEQKVPESQLAHEVAITAKRVKIPQTHH
jgi:hypothetical protein